MAELKKSERGSKLLKFLDRYIGIPLVFILGILTLFRKKSLPENVKKIALLKTAAIGDTVLLTSIIQDLKKNYPGAQIHLYCGKSNYGFGKLIADCDKVIELPIKNVLKLKKIIQFEEYDLFLDFGAWPRINSICSYWAKAEYKVGFKTRGQGRHYIYDKTVLHSDQIHELENYRNILRAINIEPNSILKLPPGKNIDSLKIPKPYVVCHLWPGGERSDLKEWSLENWKTLILAIIKARNHKVVLTGGSEDKEKNKRFLSMFNSNPDNIFDLSGVSLSETISILENAELVISVNTGVMHMAAASGVPTVGLHGPTSVKRWGPVGNNVYSVTSRLEGCQYLNLGFEYKSELKCMESISYGDVFTVVGKIL